MKIDDSYKAFRSFLKQKGKTVGALSISEGLSAAAEFFGSARMDDAAEDDGDGLIFYYAIVNRGRGSPFEVGVIRTFRKTSGGVARLRLTFNYPWVEVLIHKGLQEKLKPAVPEGTKFCWQRQDLPQFEQFMLHHPVVETVETIEPRSVNLKLEPQWGAHG